MALYAIGDVQGCDAELGALARRPALLARIAIDFGSSAIWSIAALIRSAVLRRIRALGDAATVTLGNHDLHLLAVAFGSARDPQRRYLERNPWRPPTATPCSSGSRAGRCFTKITH